MAYIGFAFDFDEGTLREIPIVRQVSPYHIRVERKKTAAGRPAFRHRKGKV
jgi:hypothetical protein